MADELHNVISEASEKYELIQHDEEFIPFIEFLKAKNVQSFIEIGTYRGGTLFVLSKMFHGKKISIDFPNPAFGYSDTNKDIRGYIDVKSRTEAFEKEFTDIHFVVADSHLQETSDEVKTLLQGQKVDFLFIDGDHTYEGVKKDYEMYRALVREGGLIAFHDIKDCLFHRKHHCRVDLFWKELQGDKTEFLSEHEDRGIGVVQQ